MLVCVKYLLFGENYSHIRNFIWSILASMRDYYLEWPVYPLEAAAKMPIKVVKYAARHE